MKASSAFSSRSERPMGIEDREPLLNARFRVEIEGLPASGVVEVIFPEARITSADGNARVQYGPLTMRRGMTTSSDWYRWWDSARGSAAAKRRVTIVLMDRLQADVHRWTFSDALPSAYAVSPLNALRGEPLIETLELSVGGFDVSFGASDEERSGGEPVRTGDPRPRLY